MNFLLTFDCSDGSAKPIQYDRYDDEKGRRKRMKQAQQDAQNNPAARIWVVDVTGNGIESNPLEECNASQ